jgi:hypothetical protein
MTDTPKSRTTVALIWLVLLTVGCTTTDRASDTDVTPRPSSSATELASAEAAWQAAAIRDSRLEMTITGCFACAPGLEFSTTVTDGVVSDATVPDGMKKQVAPTVEKLFDVLESYGADATRVRYNDVGVPLKMHLDHPDMSDDEADYEVVFIQL